jgi:hypothetical protein
MNLGAFSFSSAQFKNVPDASPIMAYKLFDKNNALVNPDDLQNRAVWYEHGMTKEQAFVKAFGTRLKVIINPEKAINPTVPDLLYHGKLADLKCQDTPFFIADNYGIPATYAVTFNLKDALHYGSLGKNYPDLSIFFWIDWVAIKMEKNGEAYSVEPLTGVWCVGFNQLNEIRLQSPIHWYHQRTRHQESSLKQREMLVRFEPRLQEGNKVWAIRERMGNAACSYVFDARRFEQVG